VGSFKRAKPMLAFDDIFAKVAGAGTGFVVVYNQRDHFDGPQFLRAQRYSGIGIKIGPEFGITNPGRIGQHQVTQLADGGFVVVWSAGPTHSAEIYARRYNGNGVAITKEFVVNTTLAGIQGSPTVAAMANGGFVVAWLSAVAGGKADIFAQRYAANGAKAGGQLRLTATPEESESVVVVGSLHNDGFVVAWSSSNNIIGDHLRGRRYTSAGLPSGAEFLISGPAGAVPPRSDPTLSVLDDDRFLLAYGRAGEIYAKLLGAMAADDADAPEFKVNSAALAGFRGYPSSVALSNRNMFVAWEMDPAAGTLQVRLRRLDFPPTVP